MLTFGCNKLSGNQSPWGLWVARWLSQGRHELRSVAQLLGGLLKFPLSALPRFDTYRFKKESERLAQYLNAVPTGRILSIAVNDEGSRNLDDTARKVMTKLGSKHFLHLGFRYLRPSPLPPPGSRTRPQPRPQSVSLSLGRLLHPQGTSGDAGSFSICRGRTGLVLRGSLRFLTSTPHSESAGGLCFCGHVRSVATCRC